MIGLQCPLNWLRASLIDRVCCSKKSFRCGDQLKSRLLAVKEDFEKRGLSNSIRDLVFFMISWFPTGISAEVV